MVVYAGYIAIFDMANDEPKRTEANAAKWVLMLLIGDNPCSLNSSREYNRFIILCFQMETSMKTYIFLT